MPGTVLGTQGKSRTVSALLSVEAREGDRRSLSDLTDKRKTAAVITCVQEVVEGELILILSQVCS